MMHMHCCVSVCYRPALTLRGANASCRNQRATPRPTFHCRRRHFVDVFSSIDMQPVGFWQMLVWMDDANFAGSKESETVPQAKKRTRKVVGTCRSVTLRTKLKLNRHELGH